MSYGRFAVYIQRPLLLCRAQYDLCCIGAWHIVPPFQSSPAMGLHSSVVRVVKRLEGRGFDPLHLV